MRFNCNSGVRWGEFIQTNTWKKCGLQPPRVGHLSAHQGLQYVPAFQQCPHQGSPTARQGSHRPQWPHRRPGPRSLALALALSGPRPRPLAPGLGPWPLAGARPRHPAGPGPLPWPWLWQAPGTRTPDTRLQAPWHLDPSASRNSGSPQAPCCDPKAGQSWHITTSPKDPGRAKSGRLQPPCGDPKAASR